MVKGVIDTRASCPRLDGRRLALPHPALGRVHPLALTGRCVDLNPHPSRPHPPVLRWRRSSCSASSAPTRSCTSSAASGARLVPLRELPRPRERADRALDSLRRQHDRLSALFLALLVAINWLGVLQQAVRRERRRLQPLSASAQHHRQPRSGRRAPGFPRGRPRPGHRGLLRSFEGARAREGRADRSRRATRPGPEVRIRNYGTVRVGAASSRRWSRSRPRSPSPTR
jgi:hypothetical protein